MSKKQQRERIELGFWARVWSCESLELEANTRSMLGEFLDRTLPWDYVLMLQENMDYVKFRKNVNIVSLPLILLCSC
jgi:hypothetical protein